MNIGIAQIKPVKGNIMANIEKHIQFVNTAVSLKASSVFFPELSLTGYEPELAKKLAIEQNDSRLEVFQKASDIGKITIGVGVPTIHPQGLQISMLIFQPKKPRILYSKQQLHEDEFPYFENGDKQVLITVENQKIIPAICFESLQTNHADKAVKLGGQLYVASVAKSQTGINKAYKHYPEVAKKYRIPVLMSNCIGECDNFISAGCSSVWTKEGKLITQLESQSEGIMVFNTETEKVTKQVFS